MNQSLNNDSIINPFPSRHESCLHRGDKIIQERSKLIHNNLVHYLVNNVTLSNWAVISKSFWTLAFGDKRNKGSVKIIWYFLREENLLYFLHHFRPNRGPELLKESGMEAI